MADFEPMATFDELYGSESAPLLPPEPPEIADIALIAHPRGETGDLLDRVDGLLGRFVAFPSDSARHAAAAWVIHTHAIDAFESTPRLAALSPEKGSGKTRLLEMLELLTPGSLMTVNISPPALFRKIDAGSCTILLDEADTYLGVRVAKDHEDLRGLVNAGHRRGAVAYRCSIGAAGVTVNEFPAFAPVALAGIGDLPDTILDRSIVISMKRRGPTEVVEGFRHRKVSKETEPLRDLLAEWAEKHTDEIREIEPDMPEGIVDRAGDVWEALIMIGDYAGPPWAELLRNAAVNLDKQRQDRDPSLGVKLLTDGRCIFTEKNVDRISTVDLLVALIALDESPWGDLRGNELDARGLARRLRPYEVRPADHIFDGATKKGYQRSDFHDAWARYLPPEKGNEGNEGNEGTDPDYVDTVIGGAP